MLLKNDKLIDVQAFVKLNTAISNILKTSEKSGKDVKVARYYVYSAKSKPVQYSASLEKKKDLKYLKKRAIKILERKSFKGDALTKYRPLLFVLEGSDVPKAIATKIKDAEKAIATHQKQLDKHTSSMTEIRDTKRKESEQMFNETADHIYNLLEEAGISNVVESSGLGGRAILAKLAPNIFVAITASTAKRFKDAKAQSAE